MALFLQGFLEHFDVSGVGCDLSFSELLVGHLLGNQTLKVVFTLKQGLLLSITIAKQLRLVVLNIFDFGLFAEILKGTSLSVLKFLVQLQLLCPQFVNDLLTDQVMLARALKVGS